MDDAEEYVAYQGTLFRYIAVAEGVDTVLMKETNASIESYNPTEIKSGLIEEDESCRFLFEVFPTCTKC